MIVDVKVPILAESIPDATLLDWRKQPGEWVEKDEIVIELETDKIVLEVPAPAAGVLTDVLKQTGETALSQEVLARIDPDTAATAAATPPNPAPAVPVTPTPSITTTVGGDRLSPAVHRLVDEHRLDPSQITGTGKDQRITKGDVLAHINTAATTTATAPEPIPVAPITAAPARVEAVTGIGMPAPLRGERREPMSRLRRRIAERLVEAQHTAAILTTFNEVNMQPVIALRSRYKESFERRHGVRLGFMSFFAKAAVQAIQRFPAVNASIEDDHIVYHDYCDLGVAVGSPRGLVVPILRNVEAMSFAAIESKLGEFGAKARDGSLSIDEMQGGTFTISNGGVFGSLLSTPILNPPQSGILGMHKTMERPVVEDGAIVARPMMYLALSYDHRIIDGREAVQFLVCVKEAIEDPARLLLDV